MMKSLLLPLLATFIAVGGASPASDKVAAPNLKIVQDSLIQREGFYAVRGSVYNPSAKGAKNVVITYRVWKKFMGKDGWGLRIKETGGLLVAKIKYVPPKQTVEFTTAPTDNAPVQIGIEPDPTSAEITAESDTP